MPRLTKIPMFTIAPFPTADPKVSINPANHATPKSEKAATPAATTENRALSAIASVSTATTWKAISPTALGIDNAAYPAVAVAIAITERVITAAKTATSTASAAHRSSTQRALLTGLASTAAASPESSSGATEPAPRVMASSEPMKEDT